MKRILNWTLACIGVFILGVGCSLFDKPEQIPAFIHIEKIDLETTSGQGENSHGIVDAWIYVNNIILGVFELPVTVPILKEGVHTVKVVPGIKKNGVSSERTAYPFYEPFEVSLDLQPKIVDTLKPIVKYKSNTKIWLEDFENFGSKFNTTPESDTTLTITNNPAEVIDGNGTGKSVLSDGQGLFQIETNEPTFTELVNSYTTYLEMDFITNSNPLVGMKVTQQGTSVPENFGVVVLNPSAQRKKIYVELTAEVKFNKNAENFQLYLQVLNPNNTVLVSYFDNIKVVYFK